MFFIHGGTEVEDREAIRKIMEVETNAIILASYGVYQRGINIRNLHNIIFASPSKSLVRVMQSIGRGLRTHETKDHLTLYDLSDDMRYKTYMNHTLKHFVVRSQMYTDEKHNFKIYKIALRSTT